MFVRELAMFFSCFRVMLRLFVFAHRVMVVSLMVMMGGGVVMTCRGVMMFGGRVFRHLSALRFDWVWSDRRRQSPIFPE
jgi:hypothetical protein